MVSFTLYNNLVRSYPDHTVEEASSKRCQLVQGFTISWSGIKTQSLISHKYYVLQTCLGVGFFFFFVCLDFMVLPKSENSCLWAVMEKFIVIIFSNRTFYFLWEFRLDECQALFFLCLITLFIFLHLCLSAPFHGLCMDNFFRSVL